MGNSVIIKSSMVMPDNKLQVLQTTMDFTTLPVPDKQIKRTESSD